jgi:hypothetical protein
MLAAEGFSSCWKAPIESFEVIFKGLMAHQGRFVLSSQTRGVSHCGLAVYIKRYLNEK